MKKLILSAVMALLATGVFAQGYQTGVGVRGGYVSGVTLKHFIDEPVPWRAFCLSEDGDSI